MAEEGGSIESLIQALAHDKRRQIITLLAEEGPKGVTELKSRLGLSTGSLYHNLDFLEGFIERDGRKYKLNDRGMELYRMMRQGTLNPPFEQISIIRSLMPIGYMRMLIERPTTTLILSLIAALALFFSAYFKGYGIILLVLSGPWMDRKFSIMSIALSFAVMTSTTALIFRNIKLRNFIPLMLIGLLPHAVYSLIADYIYTFGGPVSETIYLLIAGVGVLTIASAIRVASGARMEYALLFSFILVYSGSVLAPILSSSLA